MTQSETDRALDAVEESSTSDSSTFTAQNGIKLRLKKVSRLLVVEAGRKIEIPKVPVVHDEALDRKIDNPNHPDYLQAMQEYNWKVGNMGISAYWAMGTEIVQPLPAGIIPPESDDWFEIFEELGMSVAPLRADGSVPRSRYLSWLKYYALSDADQTELMTRLMTFSGEVSEEEVARAAETFRNQTPRPLLDGVPPSEEA